MQLLHFASSAVIIIRWDLQPQECAPAGSINKKGPSLIRLSPF